MYSSYIAQLIDNGWSNYSSDTLFYLTSIQKQQDTPKQKWRRFPGSWTGSLGLMCSASAPTSTTTTTTTSTTTTSNTSTTTSSSSACRSLYDRWSFWGVWMLTLLQGFVMWSNVTFKYVPWTGSAALSARPLCRQDEMPRPLPAPVLLCNGGLNLGPPCSLKWVRPSAPSTISWSLSDRPKRSTQGKWDGDEWGHRGRCVSHFPFLF